MHKLLVLAAAAMALVACGSSGDAPENKVPEKKTDPGVVETPGPDPERPEGSDDEPRDTPGDQTPDPGPVTTTTPVQPASPPDSLYDDGGAAAPQDPMRAVLSFAMRDADALDAIDDPSSAQFHKFLSHAEWMDKHAPKKEDVDAVKTFLEGKGFKVPHVATNRMLLEISGTVELFQKVFATEVHVFHRTAPGGSNASKLLISVVKPIVTPKEIEDKTRGVLITAPGASTTPLPEETPTKQDSPPDPGSALSPSNVAAHYGFDALGSQGDGETIAVVMGAAFKRPDLRAYWKAMNITREEPEVVLVGEGPAIRATESSVDIEWSTSMAPKAKTIAYQAADVHDLSLILAFNEAVGAGKATVVTDSFAHRETNVSKAVAFQYEISARMGAALGVTIVSPTGDSFGVDIPSTCPHVVAVGGTFLEGDRESVWTPTGAGPSHYFDRPTWQKASTNKRRMIPDVSLAAGTPYWTLHLGEWKKLGGTSFGAPVFAAMVAAINAKRVAAGKGRLGHFNPSLYATPAIQASFRDVTTGAADTTPAVAGWDAASGWGSPHASNLAASML
ncbi:MAG: S53 family serine peptidase [Labilithrix sp.]